MDTSRASYDSEVMGYHVYQDIWEPTIGEILGCFREMDNFFDAFAVCVKKDTEIVGHVPRKFHLFVRCFYEIMVLYNVRSQGERGIPQSGLEIPCHLLFEGTKKYIDITPKKLESTLSTTKETLKTTLNDQEHAG